jgi:hypothetical protein
MCNALEAVMEEAMLKLDEIYVIFYYMFCNF